MEEGKSSHLSQIEEDMNFTLSKVQSTEIKESIRIADSNILAQIKNSIEIKPPNSNFKKAYEQEKEKEQEKRVEILEINQETSNENQEFTIEKEKVKENNDLEDPVINKEINNLKITEEQSLNISPKKTNHEESNEKQPNEDEAQNLAKQLNVIKKNRKQINLEAQVLANRIALLKQEELKTMKKIKETKNKADEIYKLKKQNYEKSLEVKKQFFLI